MSPDTTPKPTTDAEKIVTQQLHQIEMLRERLESASELIHALRTDRNLQANKVERLAGLLAQCAESLEEKERIHLASRSERDRLKRIKEALELDSQDPVSEGTGIAAEARAVWNNLSEEARKRYASLAEDVLKLHKPDEGSVWANHGLSEPIEPAPKWRLLGPDDDKVVGKFSSEAPGLWEKCQVCEEEYGYHTGAYKIAYCRRVLLSPKKVVNSVDVIEKHANSPLAQWRMMECLRYLRDEIESLNRRVGGAR